MAKSLLALLFVALYCTSYANAGYEVTSPTTGTLINGGDYASVIWNINNVGPTEKTVDVILNNGPPENLVPIYTLCKGIDPNVKTCNFPVPADMPTGIDYTIAVGGIPDNYAYSNYFTIKGVGEIPPNNGCPNMGGHVCNSADLACCGVDGFCGIGPNFCGTGCQPQFSLAGSCGGGKAKKPKRRSI
ncbi:unnamed protein product [Rhizophagus irregularis]|uniref:Chitin-binding type-1 domain-containing protein n=1 Tax=Rhizophagus irregularis TaxID=588596 RepID=A0A2N1N7V6_9GLOM|nr:hypothetical protein RhiirC2_747535 [Rhizophagus irregularis]CAB4400738.1 unnamed protein product [Rhizophagus irregularis]CAB5380065.1 unnamed protein product [Rhizophagus irregularis]